MGIRMKKLGKNAIGVAAVVFAVSGLAGAAVAESNAEKIARAMSAAPSDISA